MEQLCLLKRFDHGLVVVQGMQCVAELRTCMCQLVMVWALWNMLCSLNDDTMHALHVPQLVYTSRGSERRLTLPSIPCSCLYCREGRVKGTGDKEQQMQQELVNCTGL